MSSQKGISKIKPTYHRTYVNMAATPYSTGAIFGRGLSRRVSFWVLSPFWIGIILLFMSYIARVCVRGERKVMGFVFSL
jgi:hypothetical protein